MADLDPALVERAAIAAVGGREVWMRLSENKRSLPREGARAALLSLGIPAAALNALARGEAVVANRSAVAQAANVLFNLKQRSAGSVLTERDLRTMAEVSALLDASRYAAEEAAVAGPKPTPRSLDDWHEDIGPALWWFFPLCEAPYVGSPLDQDWPGYHTHWTPIECPNPPAPTGVSHDPRKRR